MYIKTNSIIYYCAVLIAQRFGFGSPSSLSARIGIIKVSAGLEALISSSTILRSYSNLSLRSDFVDDTIMSIRAAE